MYRFDYSIGFLRWALKPPDYKKEWHVGVRAEKSGKMVTEKLQKKNSKKTLLKCVCIIRRVAFLRARCKVWQNGDTKEKKKKIMRIMYHEKNGMFAFAPKNPAKW